VAQNPIAAVGISDQPENWGESKGAQIKGAVYKLDGADRDTAIALFSARYSFLGDAVSYRNDTSKKSELVIFLKPTVISNPSLDSDELKFFRRFLPTIDPTGKTP
jgi:hypothetical protein